MAVGGIFISLSLANGSRSRYVGLFELPSGFGAVSFLSFLFVSVRPSSEKIRHSFGFDTARWPSLPLLVLEGGVNDLVNFNEI